MRIQLFFRLVLLVLSSIYVGLVSGECVSCESICLEDQMCLLLQLRNTLHFHVAASSKLVSWNPITDCCSWGGVTCDSAGHVVGLDLSNESIYGGFNGSSSLFGLHHLQSLNLAYNIFNLTSQQIPSEIGELGHLIYLNLSYAGFVGQVPIGITRLRKLVTIDLSTVGLLRLENPNLRMLLQNLSELRELYLDGVNISTHGKEWCQALSDSVPNLQILSMQRCDLSGPLDSSLRKLRSLSSITLNFNSFSAPVPKFFANFPNLNELRLSHCDLNGIFPEKILQVPILQILDLSYNEFLRGSLPEFPQNGYLQTLVLSRTNFSGQLPSSIGSLKRLTRIELAGCDFSGEIPNSMTALTQLANLDLSSNKFSGPVPRFSLSKKPTNVNLSQNNLTYSIPSSHWHGLANLVSLDLSYNSLNGSLPMLLFSLPSLEKIQLSHNIFSGPLSEFNVSPCSLLKTLDLSSNNLEGPIPESLFYLQHLITLDLSSNKFNGSVELSIFKRLRKLGTLSLSYNNLSIGASPGNTTPLPSGLTTLKLVSCGLTTLPDLSTHSRLIYLDLSANQIGGNIPSWIWNSIFCHLNLSHNLLEGLQQPTSSISSSVLILDLHANRLHGQFPIPTVHSIYMDYSENEFSSSIPDDIGTYLTSARFFSLSRNKIYGSIPESICNATSLQVLDLSDNRLSGKIPPCLIQNRDLAVLNLGRNELIGKIPSELLQTCRLQTLDLNGNHLEGRIPESIFNCKELKILNVGNNLIHDTFPCWLKNLTSLHVLVLRGNKFHGPIRCAESDNSTWPMLQIVDLAHNNFGGKLLEDSFSRWTAMMGSEIEVGSKPKYLEFMGRSPWSPWYYRDAVTVTCKGNEMKLEKVITLFASIDLSDNNFGGQIPEVTGNFSSLYAFNLSHNAFTGQIPSSMGNLRQLESLDLSRNRLSGDIPTQLASLNFLSFLNLSSNQLVGKIPTGTQFQTFSASSFMDNKGLCGFPLNVSCREASAPTFDGRHSSSTTEINWEYLAPEIGFVTGLGMVIWPLLLCREWRRCYYENVDILLSRILYTN